MSKRLARTALCALALALPAALSWAQKIEPYEGYLCCNLYSYSGWMDDDNSRESWKVLVPVGTPVKVISVDSSRIYVEIDGKRQRIGNQYSRKVDMLTFTHRYVVTFDPNDIIAKYPAAVRAAIKAGKIMRGMSRIQVAMAVGYPPADGTPKLEDPLWLHWPHSRSQFKVFWTEDGKGVDCIFGSKDVLDKVAAEPLDCTR